MNRPRVVLLGGASGAGKSYLARRHGRPHLELDAYYHEISDDGRSGVHFPRTPYGEIDWDDPRTWNLQAAVDALVELIETGRTRMPDYSITTSSVVGSTTLELGTADSSAATVRPGQSADLIVAEGVFADVAAQPLRAACADLGVRVDAYYIDQNTLTTATRRFARDVAERRKPIPFLVQRGWALARSERRSRARHLDVGFVPVPKSRLRAGIPEP
ncbi:uridine kinase [Micrococcus terreus]|uniref:uridine kinase family protein n=1 Tax=Micrococcus terreus TaxID=574650 RepID=UPI0021A5336F|nr:uridine kinase [Micrococcus terreus]MCT2088585.1 uridine kinase [Micrococcus terreus]